MGVGVRVRRQVGAVMLLVLTWTLTVPSALARGAVGRRGTAVEAKTALPSSFSKEVQVENGQVTTKDREAVHPKISSDVLASVFSVVLASLGGGNRAEKSQLEQASPAAPRTLASPMLQDTIVLHGGDGRDVDLTQTEIRVRVDAVPGKAEEARAAIERAGGVVEVRGQGALQARVPFRAVTKLADSESVDYVSFPRHAVSFELIEEVTEKTAEEVAQEARQREERQSLGIGGGIPGQGVKATNASYWHETLGILGKDVKVGVIDLGFSGYETAFHHGEVPSPAGTFDLCRGALSSASLHGTAVVEIVHDMAPAADIYLACVASALEFGRAYWWLREQGVDIISSSIGWLTGSGTGKSGPGTPDAVVAQARSEEIFWVTAAGNESKYHWGGPFQDANKNGLHEFSFGVEANEFSLPGGKSAILSLDWEEYPFSNHDYDLYVLDDGGFIVGSSVGFQTGVEFPVEIVTLSNTSMWTRKYSILIVGEQTAESPILDLFVGSFPLSVQTSSGSIVAPGMSADVMTIGASNWVNGFVEGYSSRGPTHDGRTKPDISAPTRVASFTYKGLFAGTSASTPHAAGAAALVLEANPSFGPAEIQAYLEGHAIDVGIWGKDNTSGAGKLWLPEILPSEAASLPTETLPRARPDDSSGEDSAEGSG